MLQKKQLSFQGRKSASRNTSLLSKSVAALSGRVGLSSQKGGQRNAKEESVSSLQHADEVKLEQLRKRKSESGKQTREWSGEFAKSAKFVRTAARDRRWAGETNDGTARRPLQQQQRRRRQTAAAVTGGKRACLSGPRPAMLRTRSSAISLRRIRERLSCAVHIIYSSYVQEVSLRAFCTLLHLQLLQLFPHLALFLLPTETVAFCFLLFLLQLQSFLFSLT